MTNLTKRWFRAGALAAMLPLAACDTSALFEVDSPGKIADADLNSKDAIPGLLAGISAEIADMMGTELIEFAVLAAGEMSHGGSYDWADIPRGIIVDEDIDNEWEEMHQARWVAEDGLRRMSEEILTEAEFNRNASVARAYYFAGIANRTLGDFVCQTVFDGSAPEANTVHFQRAEGQLTRAIAIGTAAGSGANNTVTASYGARAYVRAALGNWAGAVEDAAKVPVAFVTVAALNTESPSNELFDETHNRFEYTVFATEFAEHTSDPRAPWHIERKADGSVATGANGSTPHYQQDKYKNFGSDIPLVKGTEMLLIRAEAALRNKDLAQARSLMNEARTFYRMEALPESATASEAAAWKTLHKERGSTLWLENRRFGDLRRWNAETGPAHHAYLDDRFKCVPISKEEKRANPNARG